MIETPTAATSSETALPRAQIALSFFAFILVGVVDGAVGVLLPSLQAFYRVDKATVSLIFLCSTAGYSIAAFSSGPLTEVFGRRRLLALGAVAVLVATLMISRTPPFPALLAAALVGGFGIATLDAGLNAFFAGLPRGTSLLNYLHAFFGVGAFLGPFVASTLLAANRPWNEAYLLWAILAAAVLVALLRFFPRTAHPDARTGRDAAGGNILAATLRLRVVWFAALFLLFYVGAEITAGNWSYSYLTELHRQPTLLSGWAVSGYWLGVTAGRLSLAQLAVRWGQSERRLIALCIGGFAVTGLLPLWIAPTVAAMPALFLAGFWLGPIFPTVIALVPSLVPARVVPGAVGFLASFGSAGAAFFPWLAGVLAGAAGLGTLMPYLAALSLVMALWWLAVQAWGGVRRHEPAAAAAPTA